MLLDFSYHFLARDDAFAITTFNLYQGIVHIFAINLFNTQIDLQNLKLNIAGLLWTDSITYFCM